MLAVLLSYQFYVTEITYLPVRDGQKASEPLTKTI